MYIHKKIIKKDNIEYYICKNTASDNNYFIMGYLKNGKEVINSDVLAWINGKTKKVEYNETADFPYNVDIINNIASYYI